MCQVVLNCNELISLRKEGAQYLNCEKKSFRDQTIDSSAWRYCLLDRDHTYLQVNMHAGMCCCCYYSWFSRYINNGETNNQFEGIKILKKWIRKKTETIYFRKFGHQSQVCLFDGFINDVAKVFLTFTINISIQLYILFSCRHILFSCRQSFCTRLLQNDLSKLCQSSYQVLYWTLNKMTSLSVVLYRMYSVKPVGNSRIPFKVVVATTRRSTTEDEIKGYLRMRARMPYDEPTKEMEIEDITGNRETYTRFKIVTTNEIVFDILFKLPRWEPVARVTVTQRAYCSYCWTVVLTLDV